MKDQVERAFYDVFILDDIKYLPHYKNCSVYVGPGYKDGGVAYSKDFMTRSGATKTQELLWTRSTFGTVKNVLE